MKLYYLYILYYFLVLANDIDIIDVFLIYSILVHVDILKKAYMLYNIEYSLLLK